ncbi:MAG: hypothetical protein KBB01_01515 [Candidatus Omnitrophica bacterium]|nr:hypothetical protein [Candidatus Omnitrophota bacterium]
MVYSIIVCSYFLDFLTPYGKNKKGYQRSNIRVFIRSDEKNKNSLNYRFCRINRFSSGRILYQ